MYVFACIVLFTVVMLAYRAVCVWVIYSLPLPLAIPVTIAWIAFLIVLGNWFERRRYG
jgi:hypothetical protein